MKVIAWRHNNLERYECIHNEAKELWLKFNPSQVENYTIPLYGLEEVCNSIKKKISGRILHGPHGTIFDKHSEGLNTALKIIEEFRMAYLAEVGNE